MNKKWLMLIMSLSLILSSFAFTSCDLFGVGDDDNNSFSESESAPGTTQSGGTDFDNPAFRNEEDGADLKPASHGEEDYIGKWSTKSDKAEFLYGNVDLNIKDDHTWTGNITEDPFRGTWKAGADGIIIQDGDGFIKWNLFFVKDGTMMFKDLDEPDSAALVLIKE